MAKTFLKAEWRKLIITNYAVDQDMLKKYLPYKTEIDLWKGNCYVSLVGFLFKNTKLKGLRIPFHTSFEEVNLRFYVRYNDNGMWKRGVVFIKEIVPKFALALIANIMYNENYETLPMKHSWESSGDKLSVEYKWKKGNWNSLKVIAGTTAIEIENESEEEFITEHYWGYTKISSTKTSEYGVEHSKWKVYPIEECIIDIDFERIYGKDFGFLNQEKHKSIFLAEGSEIEVKEGRVI